MSLSILLRICICVCGPLLAFAAGDSIPLGGPISSETHWKNFENELRLDAELRRRSASSYIASGLLVSIGGIIGQQRTSDTSARVTFGFAQGLGAFAFGHGMTQFLLPPEDEALWQSLARSAISDSQRGDIVSKYHYYRAERQKLEQRLHFTTHMIVAGFNFYAAHVETDTSGKSVLTGLGIVQLLYGVLSYDFN